MPKASSKFKATEGESSGREFGESEQHTTMCQMIYVVHTRKADQNVCWRRFCLSITDCHPSFRRPSREVEGLTRNRPSRRSHMRARRNAGRQPSLLPLDAFRHLTTIKAVRPIRFIHRSRSAAARHYLKSAVTGRMELNVKASKPSKATKTLNRQCVIGNTPGRW